MNKLIIDGKVHSIRNYIDIKNNNYCIIRIKVKNEFKGVVKDTNLLDCYAYRGEYGFIMKEVLVNDNVRVSGPIQRRGSQKNWTLYVKNVEKITY